MLKIRNALILMGVLMTPLAHSATQVSIGIGFPNVSIGINIPAYPQLVAVPGYPVYYAPRMQANYFFYDGLYWVFQGDNWYASSWYNGPWWFVEPYAVPVYVLRVPVRYYRSPPSYFRAWRSDAPPRWGNHWGPEWEQHRSGWDRWDRRAAPAPAPLPTYQRQYSGDRYPRQVAQQRELQQERYRYRPRDPIVRKQYQERYEERPEQRAPDGQNRQGGPEERGSRQQDIQRPAARPQESSRGPGSPEAGDPNARERRQLPQPGADQRQQQPRGSQDRDERQQGKDAAREHKRNQEQEKDRDRDRDRDRNN
ncbi:MAG: hypothetical protein ACYCY9_02270 [Thiobacillus sp.]